MKKLIKSITAIFCICAIIMFIPSCINTENNKQIGENLQDNQEIDNEEYNELEIYIDPNNQYKYVYFGSYPQKEIVSCDIESGVYGKIWATEEDYIVDSNVYYALNNLSDDAWNDNGDTIIDDIKYRRIKANDAIYSTLDDSNYYDWSSTDSYHYFKYEPIKWRVLEQGDNKLFLISEIVLDNQKYNTKITNITWETSTIRSWLNGYDNSVNLYGTDYSNCNFIDSAFTLNEQAMILSTTLKNDDNINSGTEGGNDTIDKIFLLSEEEVYGDKAITYGFSSDYNAHDIVRQAKSSTYAKAMGVDSDNESETSGNCFWWLRTPGSYTGLYILIRCNGSVYRGGQHADSKTRGVRPAICIQFK